MKLDRRYGFKGKDTWPASAAVILLAAVLLPAVILASPSITSVTMVPPNPGFGQEFTVTVNYCANLYVPIFLAAAVSTDPARLNAQLSGSGQVFLVSSSGENVQAQNFASGAQIGLQVRGVLGFGFQNCTDCAGQAAATGSYTVVLKMPEARDFPGCNIDSLYFHVMMRDSNIQESVWDDAADSCPPYANAYVTPSWPIPTPDQDFTIHKRAEGVLQDAGDLLLYSIDYEYANGPLTITDIVPRPSNGQFTLEAVGPASMWAGTPAIGTTFQNGDPARTITWNLPNRTGIPGYSSGTVWFLLRMTGDITDNTVISNTATGTMPTAGVKNSTTGVTVGQSVVTIIKSQESGYVNYGETATYYLNYTINGSKLVSYEPFDDIAGNTYNTGTGPPPGWTFRDPADASQQWYVYDECGTGDNYMRGTSANSKYPQLLLNDNFCQGIIVSDVMIDADYEGADALVVIRTNGTNTYGLLVTVDYNPGGGPISIQHGCNPGCSYDGGSPTHGVIMTDTWYRVKIQSDTGCDFKAKIWKKGEAEPAAWMINWTDGSCVTCTGDPANWHPGLAQQGGATGYTHDIYNNFMIYNPRTSVSTSLYDTIPAGIAYVGSNGPTSPTTTTPRINWNLGSISNEGGSYTWWGVMNTCDPVTNTASMTGTGITTVISNEVETIPVCPTPVITLVKTANPATASVGDRITFTLQACNSAAGPAANPMLIWDTIPALINWGNWIGTAGTGTTAPGGLIQWNVAPLAAGACATRQWWGTINGAPVP